MGGAIFCSQHDGPIWKLSASYFSPKLNAHCRAVPGIRYDPVTHDRLGYVDAIRAAVARLAKDGITCRGADRLPVPDDWREARTPFLYSVDKLRPYQVEGVRFIIMKSREGCILADGMRLGKSAQTIVAYRAFKQKTLIVVPPHLVGVWARPKTAPEGPGEIAKWWPDAWKAGPGVVVLEGVKKTAPIDSDAMVVVVHFDIAYAWEKELIAWDFANLAVDEAHLLMGYSSRRTASVRKLAEHAKRRVYLTGTPMTSRPRDLHSVVDTLCPGRFGYFFSENQDDEEKPVATYSKLFCNAHKVMVGEGPEAKEFYDHKGASNLDEPDGKNCLTIEETLKTRLRYFMLRRIKSEVDDQLPQKQRQIINIDVKAKKQIGVSPDLLSHKGTGLRKALDLTADGKFKTVVTHLKSHVEEGEKVIAFCFRRQFAEILSDELKGKLTNVPSHVHWTHGGLTPKERDKRIHAFKKFDGPGVLCATIDTTSTGIDLSFCGVGTFCELTWEPHDLIQAEERLYKYGEGATSYIEYIVARGTGDELILRGIINKLDDFAKAIGPTGDSMVENLRGKPGGGLALLMGAIEEMQRGDEPKTKPKRKVK